MRRPARWLLTLTFAAAAAASGCTEDHSTTFNPDATRPPAGDVGVDAEDPNACVPTAAALEVCNGLDDDCDGEVDNVADDLAQLQGDPFNCGACGHRCLADNAESFCDAGECGITCLPGFSDLDDDVATGCEVGCEVTNQGVEACDGLDNDCDDETDEGFDLFIDPLNCGRCGHVCNLPGAAEHACEVGDCLSTRCSGGFEDLNADASDGCEYPCVAVEGAVEVCNGVDDDCDGWVDDEDRDGMAAPNFSCADQGVCAGVEPTCSNGRWRCAYPEAHYTSGFEQACDGRDNDCDGEIDEDFFGKGEPCRRGHGICAGRGVWECTRDGRALRCTADYQPDVAGVEVCNGLDDDCDGRVDNDVIDLEWVQVGDFRVFKYEASRPDASALSPGNLNGRACSRVDVQPWSEITLEEAQVACAVGGWRLCEVAEWRQACSGPAETRFPYGNNYNGDSCNGADFGEGDVLPTGEVDGTCLSGFGAGDMSGNLKEWTATAAGVEEVGVHFIVGGAYDNRIPGSLACDGLAIPRQDDFRFGNLGFRCCWP
jgi:hypothetical protein